MVLSIRTATFFLGEIVSYALTILHWKLCRFSLESKSLVQINRNGVYANTVSSNIYATWIEQSARNEWNQKTFFLNQDFQNHPPPPVVFFMSGASFGLGKQDGNGVYLRWRNFGWRNFEGSHSELIESLQATPWHRGCGVFDMGIWRYLDQSNLTWCEMMYLTACCWYFLDLLGNSIPLYLSIT